MIVKADAPVPAETDRLRKDLLDTGHDVYAYFNNDARAFESRRCRERGTHRVLSFDLI